MRNAVNADRPGRGAAMFIFSLRGGIPVGEGGDGTRRRRRRSCISRKGRNCKGKEELSKKKRSMMTSYILRKKKIY